MLSLFLAMLDDEQDKKTFSELYSKYNGKMFSIALTYTGDFHDAEEALQNAFVSVAKHIKDVKTDDELRLKSFLYKIVKNAAIDVAEKKKRYDFLALDEKIVSAETNPADLVEENEAVEKLTDFIATLSHKVRDVMVLNVIFELPPRKIAKILNLNIHTVRSRITSGRKTLTGKINELEKNV